MRWIFFGVIMLLAWTAVVDTAQAEKHRYAQALVSHRQPIAVGPDKLDDVDQGHPDKDDLTKRIEQDKIRLVKLPRFDGRVGA
jgi:hypothetical protein